MKTLELPSTYVSEATYNGRSDERIYLDGGNLSEHYEGRLPDKIKIGEQEYVRSNTYPPTKDMRYFVGRLTGRVLVVVKRF